VGADMAIGSQDEKGKIALFVIKVRTRKDNNKKEVEVPVNQENRGEKEARRPKETKKKQSPTRFIRTVTTPELIELGF
jgi:hypothetical protein